MSRVTQIVVDDRSRRASHEVDLVALGVGVGDGSVPIRLLGEAKWGAVLDVEHLRRLERVRELLAQAHVAVGAKLLLCSAAGFTARLRAEAGRGDVELLDLERLYHGA